VTGPLGCLATTSPLGNHLARTGQVGEGVSPTLDDRHILTERSGEWKRRACPAARNPHHRCQDVRYQVSSRPKYLRIKGLSLTPSRHSGGPAARTSFRNWSTNFSEMNGSSPKYHSFRASEQVKPGRARWTAVITSCAATVFPSLPRTASNTKAGQ
jgi:hypothetical protein